MPPDATVNALRGAPPTAGFTPGGGTSVVMPGPRNAATVKALRTRQPPTSTPGPGLQRPDNTALFAEQEGWQQQQNAAQAPRPPTPPAPGSTGTPTLIDILKMVASRKGGTPTMGGPAIPEGMNEIHHGGDNYSIEPAPYIDPNRDMTPVPNPLTGQLEAPTPGYEMVHGGGDNYSMEPIAPPPPPAVAPTPENPEPSQNLADYPSGSPEWWAIYNQRFGGWDEIGSGGGA